MTVKHLAIALMALTAPMASTAFAQTEAPSEATAAPASVTPFNVKRCVNVGNALDAPYEGAWGHTINLDHFAVIKAAGFDTIRLPVRWSAHTGEAPDFTIDADFMARVDEVLAAALEADLQVILNIHHFDEFYKDVDGQFPKFIRLWEQLALKYKDLPDTVYLEVLNEPRDALSGAAMRRMQQVGVKIIRQHHPDRPIILGGENWSGLGSLGSNAAIDDPNIVLTFHYYDPFNFTHQHAEWLGDIMPKEKRGWGSSSDKQQLKSDAEHVAWWVENSGRPIFLGEFGANEPIRQRDRKAYYGAVAKTMEAAGASWCLWSFTETFDIYDNDKEKWYPGFLDAMGMK